MALVPFLLGLVLGVSFWLWQQSRLQRQMRQALGSLHSDEPKIALPVMSRLRRGIALAQQAQAQLEEQLEMWQQILQVAPVGYLLVDDENQLVWCNDQAQELLKINNWEPGQARLLLKFVRSYELDQLIEQTRQKQQPQVREWVFHPALPDAEAVVHRRSRLVRGHSWPLADGQIGVFLENRQPFLELSQSRDRWVSDLAHELRTPLTSIRLVAETLQDRLEPPMRGWMERLMRETNRLIQLVQDWLELSQMELDPAKYLHRKPLELRSLIHLVWQSLEPLAKQKQLQLTYSGPSELWIAADESRLYRVFLNLFDNSIRYSPPQSRIQAVIEILPTADAPNLVQINIIDSGVGFASADLPHVFERLFRGDSARSRPPSTGESAQATASTSPPVSSASCGSGLGLAIVRQILLAHGGSVQAHNHPETGGAWLQIQLPYEIEDI